MKGKIDQFIKYVMDYYWEMETRVLTRHEIRVALGKRLLSSELNEHGKPYNEIPFEGDSFDRQYVMSFIERG